MDTAQGEMETMAQELSRLGGRLANLEAAVAQLEAAALTTTHALAEISDHWEAVYGAMQRSS